MSKPRLASAIAIVFPRGATDTMQRTRPALLDAKSRAVCGLRLGRLPCAGPRHSLPHEYSATAS